MNKSNSLFDKQLIKESLGASVRKLDPRTMIKNPIMFTVEIVTAVMFVLLFYILISGDTTQGSFGYNLVVFVVLFITLLFANFAEAIAEARGKAQADSLRKTREETPAKLVNGNTVRIVSSNALKKNDIFECEAGDIVPADGEIIEGLASIDESAITGESAPVIREAGGDKSSVTGGTKVLSDRIRVRVTAMPGESFLDKMISLVEGASRQKTPNEIALTILLAGFTLVFVIVCATLKPFADYVGTEHHDRRVHFAVRLPDPDHDRRTAVGDRNRRNGPGAACERHHQIGQGRRDGRRHRHAAARQDGNHHHRQPQGDQILPGTGDGYESVRRSLHVLVAVRRNARGEIDHRTGARTGPPRARTEHDRRADDPFLRRDEMLRRRPGRRPANPQRRFRIDPPDRRGGRKSVRRRNHETRHADLGKRRNAAGRIGERTGDRRHRTAGHHQDGHPRTVRTPAQDGRQDRHGYRRQPADGKIHRRKRPAWTTSSPKPNPKTKWSTSAASSRAASWSP